MTFFESIVIALISIVGAMLTVIVGWYIRKRETCNRAKEKTIEKMASNLNIHLELSKKDVERLDKIDDRIDNLKEKNDLIE